MFYNQTFLCVCHICKQPKYHVVTCTEEYTTCGCSRFNFKKFPKGLDNILELGKQLFSGSSPLTRAEAEDLDKHLKIYLEKKNVCKKFECPNWEDEAALEPEELGEVDVEIESIEDLEFSPIPDEFILEDNEEDEGENRGQK